jgi:CRP-like cAMP-binding protein
VLPRDSRDVRSIASTRGSVIPTVRVRNRLLRALVRYAGTVVTDSTEIMHRAPEGSVLYAPDMPAAAAYFPERAVVAIVCVDDDGRKIETATVGNEGMVGLPLVLGATTQAGCAVVQISGDIARVPLPLLMQALDAYPRWRDAVLAYAHAVIADLVRTQSCIRRHSAEQRCARWLLATRDRLGRNVVPVEPDWVCDTLRVARARSTSIFRQWQCAGLIRYHRRRVTIVERKMLERVTCTCYARSRT